jgi:hypothetical protein
MLICPEASHAQNSMAAVSADGSTVCVLIRALASHRTRFFFLGYENNIGKVYLVFCANNQLSYGVAWRTLSFQIYFAVTK